MQCYAAEGFFFFQVEEEEWLFFCSINSLGPSLRMSSGEHSSVKDMA